MEDYGFEYSDEEQEEQDVDIENQYYNSKGISDKCYYFHLFFAFMSCEDSAYFWKVDVNSRN